MKTPVSKNHLHEAVQWLFISLAFLGLLYLLPIDNIGRVPLRRVNILSDFTVLDSTQETAAANNTIPDSTIVQDSAVVAIKDAPPKKAKPKSIHNFVQIEDYTERGVALEHFSNALELLKQKKQKKVHIAWFGDSFSEGDVVLGVLRDSLQQTYGGMGVGFMPITAAAAKVRPTIGHTFANWRNYSVLDKAKSTIGLGISGEAWVPQGASTVSYNTVRFAGGQTRLESVKYWYSDAKAGASVSISLDHAVTQPGKLSQDSGKVHSLAIIAGGADYINAEWKGKVRLYGASLEGDYGVYLDNFSLRGNPGRKLQQINENLLKQFAALQNYDLVVLQFGLNVTTSDTKSYDFYEREMIPTVQFMQKCFPKASFLLLGVSDRSTHDENGNLVSFPTINKMTEVQKRIAETCKIAFWDTRKAMGGAGSMVTWQKSGYANSDYTHLTWAGGKKIAKLLFKALQAETSR